MTCTRCDGTGFLNVDQLPDDVDGHDPQQVGKWLETETSDHDVQLCDCGGDGDSWYGEPGSHYGVDDPMGNTGPYAYNGGLCECN